MNIDHFEEVFAYLHGEMSPEQMQLFEQRLSVDSSLAEEFQIQQRNIKEDSGKFESTLNALHRELQSPAVIFAKLKPQVDEIVRQTLEQLYKEEGIEKIVEVVDQKGLEKSVIAAETTEPKRISINRNTFSLLKIAAVLIPLIIMGVGVWLLNKQRPSYSNISSIDTNEAPNRDSLPNTTETLTPLLAITINQLLIELPDTKRNVDSFDDSKKVTSDNSNVNSSDTKNTSADISSETKSGLSESENPNDNLYPISNFCTLNSGINLLKRGQHKEAQYSFENLLMKNCLSDSNTAFAKYYLALALLAQGNNALYEKAQNLLNQAVPNLPLSEKEKAINIVALLRQK
jgi:tetratricopeptide (TPR) repeat protein